MSINECKFTDPYKNQPLSFRIVSVEDLEVTPHQRKPSDYHTDRLVVSIEKLGFLVPLMVVDNPQKEGKYVVIDGQHRLLAAKQIGVSHLPVIVVPSALAEQLVNLNVEKELNIREKCYISLSLYREYLSRKPQRLERAAEITGALENAYYVTLGMAYEKVDDLSGSAFEPVLKKIDSFLEKPLQEAYPVRDERSGLIVSANTFIKEIGRKSKEVGQWNPNIYSQAVNWANPLKGRKISAEFDEIFPTLLANLEKAAQDPSPFLKDMLSTEEL